MQRFLKATWRKVSTFINDIFEDTATAVEHGDNKKALLNIGVLIGIFIICVILGYYIVAVVVLNREFFFTWVGFPILVVLVISYLLSDKIGKNAEVNSEAADEVEMRLVAERAREIYEEIRNLIFNSMQSAAGSTPLKRPNDEFEIQTSEARGDHFYLDRLTPIYVFEGDIESSIDTPKMNLIQQELQRRVNQNVRRYPILISEEAKGRAPVEILDIKNAGGHILIEVVLTDSKSIPLIDARRRARIEYQVKQERVQDPDFR